MTKEINRNKNITLWDSIGADNWLRPYGRTQVIFIDDQINNESPLLISDDILDPLKHRLNIDFYYFTKDPEKKWGESWFKTELDKMKRDCKNPAIIFLDLMFSSKEEYPEAGSGITFLDIIRSDPGFTDVPIIICSQGKKSDSLLKKLKTKGSCQDFLPKTDLESKLESIILQFALLSDPNIRAYSKAMKIVSQTLRKMVLDDTLKEVIDDKETPIPITTIFEGNSGDGKNYLAKYLHSISSRNNNPPIEMDFTTSKDRQDGVTRLFGRGPYTSHVGFYYRLNKNTGRIDGEPVKTMSNIDKNHIILTEVGLATECADEGTIILNELGHAPSELQTILLNFIEKRVIQPTGTNYAGFIPQQGYYNIWVMITKQFQHNFIDLTTRMHRARKITIPSLEQRSEDIIPLCACWLDKSKRSTPDELFTQDALTWLQVKASSISVRTLTGILQNLPFESALRFYNVQELERAYKNVLNNSSENEISYSDYKEKKSPINSDYATFPDIPSKGNVVTELNSASIGSDNYKRVQYLLETLEATQNHSKEKPNYQDTWHIMTKPEKKMGALTIQRNIKKIIFAISNNEIIQLIKEHKSYIFIYTIIQCGRKTNVPRDIDRYNKIITNNELLADPQISALISKATEEVNKEIAKHTKVCGTDISNE